MRLAAREPSTAPTSVTMPSVIATSAVRAGAPVPSTTVPPLITRSCMLRSHLSEERVDVPDQQIRFLERGEVSATIESGVPLQVERLLSVGPRDAEHLLWEQRGRRRHLHELAHRSEAVGPLRLAVEPHRRVDRLRDPVDGEVGEDLVARHRGLEVAVVIGPRVELLDDPTREPGRGIGEAVPERLRVLALDLLVRAAASA